MENYGEMMFNDGVADLQRLEGTYDKYKSFYVHRTQDALSPDDKAFISARESFYIASVNSAGWPYIQHRGGARGFIKHIGENRLACGDYHGNRQFITMGNLQTEARVSLFFMDYLNHARLKIQGRATLLTAKDANPDILTALEPSETPIERVLVIDVVSMDWNCPKYIPTLYGEDAIRQVIGGQLGALKAENDALRAELAALKG
jgi:predicted pyridoxine 5'-phosphate oxidase superfamily flavin-nucleotide-binding protein